MKRLNWQTVEGTQESKPEELEINGATIYVRRNITRVPKDDNGNIIFVWSYNEVQLTAAEYEEYLTDLEAPSIQGVMQQIADIQTEQEFQNISQEETTETIMQTLSDIQADIAMLEEV